MNEKFLLRMPREQLWVGKLSKDQIVTVFCPEDDSESPTAHSLLVKWVMLGPNAKPGEENIVDVEYLAGSSAEESAPFCGLMTSEEKSFDQVSMDVLIPYAKVQFTLNKGSGPITIYAQHISEYYNTGADSDEDEEIEEEEDDEEEEEEEQESVLMKKRKSSNNLGPPRKMIKIEQNEDESEEESSEDEQIPDKVQKRKGPKGKESLKADVGARGDSKKKKLHT